MDYHFQTKQLQSFPAVCPLKNTRKHTKIKKCTFCAVCNENDLAYNVGDCVDGKRRVTHYWLPPATCTGGILPDDYDIPCNTSCDEGAMYDVQRAVCTQCAAGTAASDGLRMWSSWNTIPSVFTTYCRGEYGEPCNAWFGANTYVSSGKNQDILGRTNSVLEFRVKTEHPDAVLRVRLQVESENGTDGLRIIIDNRLVQFYSGYVPWTLFEYQLDPGYHIIMFDFHKNPYYDEGADRALIDYIFVDGLVLEDLRCLPCEAGYYQDTAGQNPASASG